MHFFILTSLIALAQAAAASTFQSRGIAYSLVLIRKIADDIADNTTSGISEDLFDNFKLFANFTAAAYCPNNENSTSGSLVTCSGSNCTLIEADNVTAIVEFGGS